MVTVFCLRPHIARRTVAEQDTLLAFGRGLTHAKARHSEMTACRSACVHAAASLTTAAIVSVAA